MIRKTIVAIVICAVLVGSVLGLAPIADAKKPATGLSPEEQKLVDSMSGAYAYDLCTRISTFPYPYLGEVVTGTEEDAQTCEYIANEMENLGLSDVTIDSFPLVSFDYRSASLEIESPSVEKAVLDTRSMGNSPPTPNGEPIEGELVFVGLGGAEDYDKVPGGVEGKIVLIQRSEVMWMTTPAVYEAAYHGAIAALIHNPYRVPESLNIDGAHNTIPTLSIRGTDAVYLKELLAEGPVRVKVAVDTVITEDAPAHAVYGYIWGSEFPDEYVIFEGHVDHWWGGSEDNNGAVSATMAIAKAVLDAGITPKRTMVFMGLTGHESGTGGSKESYWDWALGSYCFMNLHPDWAGKVAGVFVSDGGGVRSKNMFVEATPEINGMLYKVARDVGVASLMTPSIFTSVTSFDGWGFCRAGIPVADLWYPEESTGTGGGAFSSPYYHTDLGGMMNLIGPEYLRMDAAFRAVAGLRMCQATILPHEISELGKEAREDVGKLVAVVPDADVSALVESLRNFEAKAQEVKSLVAGLKNPSHAKVAAINSKILDCAKTVIPWLWDQDIGITYPLPGWNTVSKYDTYANDMPCLRDAITALRGGDVNTALKKLGNVATMDWGEHVSYRVYLDVVWLFNGTSYLMWAEGSLPWITNVHQDYTALKSGAADLSKEIASLSSKLSLLYEKLDVTASDVKAAFDAGSVILDSI